MCSLGTMIVLISTKLFPHVGHCFGFNLHPLKKMSRAGRISGRVSYLLISPIHPKVGILSENQITLIFAKREIGLMHFLQAGNKVASFFASRKYSNLILCQLKPGFLHLHVSRNQGCLMPSNCRI